jgi:hypothetical protein
LFFFCNFSQEKNIMTTETKATFPHDTLTPLPNERPTVALLKKLKKEIVANAISVHSGEGNGLLGHYALVVDATAYLAKSGNIAFVPPIFPGKNPTHPAGATAPQITEINRQHKADITEFNTYHKTDAALRKQLIDAIPAEYIDILQDQEMGFANVTTLEIMTHLQSNYGTLSINELTENLTQMYSSWSPNDSIEKLLTQIRTCREFAKDSEEITDTAALRAALDNVEKSGVFGDAVRDFRKKDEADQTYASFVLLFSKADKERRRLETTKSAGYHSAAIAITTDTALAATGTSAKNTPTVSGTYYCWTHGLGYSKDHTSETCSTPQPGHRKEATATHELTRR